MWMYPPCDAHPKPHIDPSENTQVWTPPCGAWFSRAGWGSGPREECERCYWEQTRIRGKCQTVESPVKLRAGAQSQQSFPKLTERLCPAAHPWDSAPSVLEQLIGTHLRLSNLTYCLHWPLLFPYMPRWLLVPGPLLLTSPLPGILSLKTWMSWYLIIFKDIVPVPSIPKLHPTSSQGGPHLWSFFIISASFLSSFLMPPGPFWPLYPCWVCHDLTTSPCKDRCHLPSPYTLSLLCCWASRLRLFTFSCATKFPSSL